MDSKTEAVINAARLLSFRVGRFCSDRPECVETAEKLDAAIMDAEQQAAGDAKSITWNWFMDEFNGHVALGDIRYIAWLDGGLELHHEQGVLVLRVATRGQLRDLIRAMKGE